MPKEQIRKRGKRKPKTEQEEAPAITPAADFEAPAAAAAPAAEPEAIGGIHPSRLAILKRTGGASRQAVTTQTEEETAELNHRPVEEQPEDGAANWTRVFDPEFPFGLLDPDVKAYFRNLEDQIKDWEGAGAAGEEREGELPECFPRTDPRPTDVPEQRAAGAAWTRAAGRYGPRRRRCA